MDMFTKRSGERLDAIERGLLELKDDPEFKISSDRNPGVCDIVFAGGGAKGVAHLGALWSFDKMGIRFKRVAGTSAGSITAALVAAGYTVEELMEELFNMDLLKLKDETVGDRLPKIARLVALSQTYGVYSGDNFMLWIERLLGKKGIHTFSQLPRGEVGMLSSLRSGDGFRFLAMASDVTHATEVVLPRDLLDKRYGYKLPGNFPVSRAVRISIAVPFFFTPIKQGDSVLVDGAFATNLPLEIFDRADIGKVRWPTIGIDLSSLPSPTHPTEDLFQFGLAIFDTMKYGQSHMSFVSYPTRICRIVEVPTAEVRTLDFGLRKSHKEQLFINGARAVLDTLRGRAGAGLRRTWNFDRYIELRNRWEFPPADAPYLEGDQGGKGG